MKITSTSSKNKVAYLGPPSTYTHQVRKLLQLKMVLLTEKATLNSFDHDRYEFVPQITCLDVFAAVQTSSVLYGVVPFENSTNGSVINTLDLLIDREKISGDVLVCGEAYLPVHHCLLGYADPITHHEQVATLEVITSPARRSPKSREAQPLFDLSRVERILSHVQAFGQCEKFLSKYLKAVECQEVSSTSKAAEIAGADKSGTSVAISSSLAGTVYGLDILADGIQDREDNTTRFFILRKGPTLDRIADIPSQAIKQTGELRWKTLVAFRVNHFNSGALADALQTFKQFHLNLTSINSRPSLIRPWHYTFVVEFEGKRETNGSGQVNEALEELSKATSAWRWLGSWIHHMEN